MVDTRFTQGLVMV